MSDTPEVIVACHACHGTGADLYEPKRPCGECDGLGVYPEDFVDEQIQKRIVRMLRDRGRGPTPRSRYFNEAADLIERWFPASPDNPETGDTLAAGESVSGCSSPPNPETAT